MKILLAFIVFMMFSVSANAGHFTEAQNTVVRAIVRAEPTLAAAVHTGGDTTIAAWLNADQSPPYYVWKTSMSRHDILTAQSVDGTVFTWAGTGYISRSQGERDAFRELFNSTGSVVPTAPNVIAAFNDIFSGAGGAANRAHVTSIGKRTARRIEAILAVGAGTLLSPSTMTVEGTVSIDEAGRMR